jgi:hypothetical protein
MDLYDALEKVGARGTVERLSRRIGDVGRS